MIPARKLRLEFRDGIYGWVDGAADVFLDCGEPRKYLVKCGLSNNQKIYVALRCLCPRATDPYTNATTIRFAKGCSADRRMLKMPIVLLTRARICEKTGASRLA
jgi:hypothetical protein